MYFIETMSKTEVREQDIYFQMESINETEAGSSDHIADESGTSARKQMVEKFPQGAEKSLPVSGRLEFPDRSLRVTVAIASVYPIIETKVNIRKLLDYLIGTILDFFIRSLAVARSRR